MNVTAGHAQNREIKADNENELNGNSERCETKPRAVVVRRVRPVRHRPRRGVPVRAARDCWCLLSSSQMDHVTTFVANARVHYHPWVQRDSVCHGSNSEGSWTLFFVLSILVGWDCLFVMGGYPASTRSSKKENFILFRSNASCDFRSNIKLASDCMI